jgi:predicted nucleic acid-binding protein
LVSKILQEGKGKVNELLVEVEGKIQSSGSVEILPITPRIFSSAKLAMHKYPKMGVSLTDWVSAVLMRENEPKIENIASFDTDFGKIGGIEEFSWLRKIDRV